ncbi:PVC-type heme-binding CxxCH protein [Luteolibacter algae]|uniref:PVC-type heme-binding CxxCH protein n=1 Tax=Luteolibacter algae TaxID=454151 RepID=A0ABW5DD09_9BACT
MNRILPNIGLLCMIAGGHAHAAPPRNPDAYVAQQELPDLSDKAPKKVAVADFTFPDDLEVTVWATTPMFFNPTNMDTDAAGRIYVAEGVNYRHHENRRPGGDRIMVLEDTDGDGTADKSICFVQEPALVAPLGVSVFDNKIVVAQPPSIIVYTDVDRDLKFDPAIDTREEILTGANARNHDHSLHATTAGPDGKWYFNQGNCGALLSNRDGFTLRLGGSYYNSGAGNPQWFNDPTEYAGKPSDDGKIWLSGAVGRMNPDGSSIEIMAHGMRNSYEHCHSSFGDLFQNDNDDRVSCRNTWLMEGGFLGYFSKDGKRSWSSDKRPDQDIPTAHWRQEDPGTIPSGDVYGSGSPTGIAFYENGALPEKYAGSLFSCEARQRVIFSYQPTLGKGAAMDLGEHSELLSSKDNVLFRPSDVMVGADGAIYVSDWFDSGVGGHKDVDESMSGTIYRIAPRGFKPVIPELGDDPLENGAKMLTSPATHVRNTGFELLKAAGKDALPILEELLKNEDRWIRARAVWLLPLIGSEGTEICRGRLTHSDPEQRLLAFRALRNAGADVLEIARVLVTDPSPAVRREIAVSLRSFPAKSKQELVVKLFSQLDNADDRTYLEACGLAAEGMEPEVWKSLVQSAAQEPLEWSEEFARITWRLQPEAAVPALIDRVHSRKLSASARRLAFDTLAFIATKDAVMTIADFANGSNKSLAKQARWWLFNRGLDEWESYGIRQLLKQRGIYDPDKITLRGIVTPEQPKTSNLPPATEIAAMEGDPARGKIQSARCMMCHRFEGNGVPFGPDLTGWVKDQGAEEFINALVVPSQSIAHGYEATRLHLNNGLQIDGIVRSIGDPIMIESMSGLTQLVPKNRIKRTEKRIFKSLMLSAEQLGLTPQDIADLAAYLRTL